MYTSEAITLERLRKRGYVSLLEMCEKIAPSRIFRETAVYETRLVYPKLVEGYLVFRQAQQDCERRCTALCCTVLRYSKQGTRSKFIEVFSARQICLAAAYSIVHRIYLILCGFLCGNNLYFLICFLYSLSLRIL